MQKYLDYLDNISSSLDRDHFYLVSLLRKYILGVITDYELSHSVDESDFVLLYIFINQLINFNDREIRYFIELPKDKDFHTRFPKGIFAGKTLSYGANNYDQMELIGPPYMRAKFETFESRCFAEITGEFDSILNGTMIKTSDYFKIITKYGDLFDYMINGCTREDDVFSDIMWEDRFAWMDSIDSRLNYIKRQIIRGINSTDNNVHPNQNWYLYSNQTDISQDILDSIEFISNEEVISIDDLRFSFYGSFRNLINNKKDFNHSKVLRFPSKLK